MANPPSVSTQEPSLALPPGTKIDEYVITRVLGRGGFGITYLAHDSHLHKDVAIKEYFPAQVAYRDSGMTVRSHTQIGTETPVYQWGLDRVIEEARVLARFDHPNLVRVKRYFEAHGTAYIVMDFAAGLSLRDFVDSQGPVQPAVVKRWLAELLDGLAHIHSASVLHRDIKPPNIIIKADGTPVLIDFGAARQAMGNRSHDVTIVQSFGYSPLEQFGSDGTLGPWSDIYALAATMYEALAGQRPPDCAARINDEKPLLLEQSPAGFADPQLARAIVWGLALRPADRPQSVEAWRSALFDTDLNHYRDYSSSEGWTVMMPGNAPARQSPAAQASHASPARPSPVKHGPIQAPKRPHWVMWSGGMILAGMMGAGAWWGVGHYETRVPAEPERNAIVPVEAESAVAIDDTPASAPVEEPIAEPPAPSAAEQADFETAEYIGVAEAYELYLRMHPAGFFSDEARARAQGTSETDAL